MKKSFLTSTAAFTAVALLFLLLTKHFIAPDNETVSQLATPSDHGEYSDQALPYYNSEAFTPHWLAPESNLLKDFHKIEAFSLVNQNGNRVSHENLKGKIYVASFFFTSCPGICPTLTASLKKVQGEFIDDDEVSLVSHTVQPSIDSVEILSQYAENHSVVTGKWHLLTGDRDQLYKLAKRSYFSSDNAGSLTAGSGDRGSEDNDDIIHTENVLLIDTNRHIRGIYNGLNKSAINNLINDIRILKGLTEK